MDLAEIPEDCPGNTTRMYLSKNNITRIRNKVFSSYPNLNFLDLSNNKISTIEPEAFSGTHLSTCLLNQNKLNFSVGTLPREAFRHLDQLKVLDISYNKMWLTSPLVPYSADCFVPVYRNDLFGQLVNLETLTMDSLPYGSPFTKSFALLTNLTSLNLRANMTNIQNNTFLAFNHSQITSLTIWSGYLVHMEALSFAPFTNLKSLDLSYNILLGFDRMSSAWPGLAFTQIQELVLMRADRFESGLVTLEASFFHGLENTRITKLILDGNNFVTVKGLFSCYLPHLEHLSINRNRLVQVSVPENQLGTPAV